MSGTSQDRFMTCIGCMSNLSPASFPFRLFPLKRCPSCPLRITFVLLSFILELAVRSFYGPPFWSCNLSFTLFRYSLSPGSVESNPTIVFLPGPIAKIHTNPFFFSRSFPNPPPTYWNRSSKSFFQATSPFDSLRPLSQKSPNCPSIPPRLREHVLPILSPPRGSTPSFVRFPRSCLLQNSTAQPPEAAGSAFSSYTYNPRLLRHFSFRFLSLFFLLFAYSTALSSQA